MTANTSGIPHPYRNSVDALAQDTGTWQCGEGRQVLALLEGLEELYRAQASAVTAAAAKVAQRFPNDVTFQEFASGLIRGATQYAAYTEQGRMAYLAINQNAIAYMNGSTDQFDQSKNIV